MAGNQNGFLDNCKMESQGFAMDGSVDLKGRPVLRSETGRWTACFFLIGYEIFERMAYYGIASNLVIYLTTKLHEGTVESSTNVSNWSGTVWITPIIGAYIADSHWGRYWTFTVFSCIYVLGMILLTLAVSLPSLRPPACKSDSNVCEKASKLQIGIFYLALYVLAVGSGGTKPNISTMGADQFDEFDTKEKLQKASFFNWWIFAVFFGLLLADTFLIYIQDRVGFTLGYAIPTVGLIISLIIFFIGTSLYRHKVQKGNPFNRMAGVIAAAASKWRVNVPSDPTQLHEVDAKEYVAKGRFPIAHTPTLRKLVKAVTEIHSADSPVHSIHSTLHELLLFNNFCAAIRSCPPVPELCYQNERFLDKAATKDGSTSRWKLLCPVTQVEETKLMIRLLPVWVTTLMPSTLSSHVNTLFIKQGTRLNRHMGSHFEIPPGSLTAFIAMSMVVSIVVYDRILVRIFRRFTGNPRGITMLQRMGIGMAINVLTMAVASITDMKRISVVKTRGLEGNEKAVAPLTVFILLPQFLLGGIAEAFLEGGKLEFFYDQAPESMQSIGTALFASTFGIGSFLTSFLLNVSSKVSGRKGHTGWILNNLNASRIYYYYAMVAILGFLNLIFFVAVSRFYAYKRATNEAFGSHSLEHAGAVTTEECHVLPLNIKVLADEMEMVKVN